MKSVATVKTKSMPRKEEGLMLTPDKTTVSDVCKTALIKLLGESEVAPMSPLSELATSVSNFHFGSNGMEEDNIPTDTEDNIANDDDFDEMVNQLIC